MSGADGGACLFGSRSDSVSPKELGNLHLVDLTLSDSENKFDQFRIVSFDGPVVEFEKDQRGFQTNSFVAVNERMVLHKME